MKMAFRVLKAVLLHLDQFRERTLAEWTLRLVASLQERVNEGRDYWHAREVCVYLLNSGLVKTLEKNCPQLREKTEALQRSVQERWASGEEEKNETHDSKLARKLDVLASQVAMLIWSRWAERDREMGDSTCSECGAEMAPNGKSVFCSARCRMRASRRRRKKSPGKVFYIKMSQLPIVNCNIAGDVTLSSTTKRKGAKP